MTAFLTMKYSHCAWDTSCTEQQENGWKIMETILQIKYCSSVSQRISFIHIHIRSWTFCFVAFSIFSLSWGNSELFGSFSRDADNSNLIYSLRSFAFSGEKHFIRYDSKPLQWTVMYAAVGGRNAEKTVQNMRTIISFLLYSVLSKRGIDNSYLIYSSCPTFFSIRVDWLHFAFTRLTVFTAGCESSKVRAL